MVKSFGDDPTNPNRALQIWLILISAASNRQTLTYEMLAQALGLTVIIGVADPLWHIKHYCQENNLPPLTVLVVGKNSGRPGKGPDFPDPNAGREEVFRYDWFSIFPPMPEELSAAYRRLHPHRQ